MRRQVHLMSQWASARASVDPLFWMMAFSGAPRPRRRGNRYRRIGALAVPYFFPTIPLSRSPPPCVLLRHCKSWTTSTKKEVGRFCTVFPLIVHCRTPADTVTVLDLPQLYTKPSAQELLNTLTLLTSEPPSWEGSDTEDDDVPMAVKSARRQSISAARAQPVQINPEGLPAYLTRIIGSSLRWIEDESVKEEIWEAASTRLSERSGRTAMGAISRKFRIRSEKDGSSEDIQIHEPALTADNLGLKTWASSYLLSRRLWRLAADGTSLPLAKDLPPYSVLELGSGTGLVGISAAMVLETKVLLTDLPKIVDNLDRNALANEAVLERHNASAYTAVLDWTDPSAMTLSAKAAEKADYQESQQFHLIFAADPIYSPEHPGWLVQAVTHRLARDASARVVIELPLRKSYRPQVEDFLQKMQAIGLKICNEGYETGYDDWGSQGGRKAVRCWWIVWAWQTEYAGEAHAVEHDEHSVFAENMCESHQQLLEEFERLDDWD